MCVCKTAVNDADRVDFYCTRSLSRLIVTDNQPPLPLPSTVTLSDAEIRPPPFGKGVSGCSDGPRTGWRTVPEFDVLPSVYGAVYIYIYDNIVCVCIPSTI